MIWNAVGRTRPTAMSGAVPSVMDQAVARRASSRRTHLLALVVLAILPLHSCLDVAPQGPYADRGNGHNTRTHAEKYRVAQDHIPPTFPSEDGPGLPQEASPSSRGGGTRSRHSTEHTGHSQHRVMKAWWHPWWWTPAPTPRPTPPPTAMPVSAAPSPAPTPATLVRAPHLSP